MCFGSDAVSVGGGVCGGEGVWGLKVRVGDRSKSQMLHKCSIPKTVRHDDGDGDGGGVLFVCSFHGVPRGIICRQSHIHTRTHTRLWIQFVFLYFVLRVVILCEVDFLGICSALREW